LSGAASPVASNFDVPVTFRTYTHSAIFVEVKIDEELGQVRCTRVVSAIAAGKIINLKTARSQILGGVVMGIGSAEGVRLVLLVDEDHVDVVDVGMHRHVVLAEIVVHEPADAVVEHRFLVQGVAAAISNAVYHATGKRIRHLPITPDKILGED
jgi:xanthine dehydrogenase YagR molybdenum-binding subunit